MYLPPLFKTPFVVTALALFLVACRPFTPAAPPVAQPSTVVAPTRAIPLSQPPTPPITPHLPTTTATPLAPITPTATPIPPSLTPTVPALLPTATPGRSQYDLQATLADNWQHLTVSQTITYLNPSAEPLAELLLVVDPNRFPGVFTLEEAHWGDGRPVADYTLAGTRLQLPLAASLAPGAAVRLTLTYTLHIPEQAGPFGRTARQVNLGDWYPFVPAYRPGQGWLVHEAASVGEHLVYDAADYRVALRLPAGGGLRLVASASAQLDGEWQRFSLPNGRSFAWSASPHYRLLTRQVGAVTLTAAVFPEHLVGGQTALKVTAEALALYSRLFSPYPHTSLAVVEADFNNDGMEYDGLFFLGAGLFSGWPPDLQGYLTPIAAHETAHQWWYGRVGNDSALEPWLDESLATYSELLFYQAEYPELVPWWWEFRVNRWQPAGWVDSTIYEHGTFRPYVDAVYLRGARWLEEARRLLGEARFLAFLAGYARQYDGRQATGAAFWALLAEYTPADLTPLRQDYFR